MFGVEDVLSVQYSCTVVSVFWLLREIVLKMRTPLISYEQFLQKNLPGGTVGYPAQPGFIRSSVCDSVHLSVRAKRGIWSKEYLLERTVIFLSACVERILRLFTNFYLQRKLLIFLRNYRDCKVVDPYNRFQPQD